MKRLRIQVKFAPRDLWIGVYVKPVWFYERLGRLEYKRRLVGLQLFVCPLPTLLIKIQWGWPE